MSNYTDLLRCKNHISVSVLSKNGWNLGVLVARHHVRVVRLTEGVEI